MASLKKGTIFEWSLTQTSSDPAFVNLNQNYYKCREMEMLVSIFMIHDRQPPTQYKLDALELL